MEFETADRIHLRDLSVRTVIGVYPEERGIRQELILNLTLFADQTAAAAADEFALTVDYAAVHAAVTELVESSSYELIESVAAAVAECLLSFNGVRACRVIVDKPGILPNCRSAAVEIFRRRP